jgi:hypothetical protein
MSCSWSFPLHRPGNRRFLRNAEAIGVVLLWASAASAQRVKLARPHAISWRVSPALGSGAPQDVATNTHGGVLVLDGEGGQLLLLDSEGNVAAKSSSDEMAKARLAHPVKTVFFAPKNILVLDDRVPSLARFIVTGHDIVFQETIPLGDFSGLSSLSSCRGEVVVLGRTRPVQRSRLIHQLNRNGTIRQSIGEQFGDSEFEHIVFGNGQIVCLATSGIVLVAPKDYPEVRAYEATGRLRWATTLRGFQSVRLIQEGERSVRFGYPPDSLWDEVSSLFLVSPDVVALQIRRRHGRSARPDVRLIETRYFSLADGRQLGAQHDLPIVAATVPGELLSVDRQDPSRLLAYPFTFTTR